MNASLKYSRTLRSGVSVLVAICTLTAFGQRAHAAELDPITISAPELHRVGREAATGAPIDKVTVQARIAVDSETLKNDSGVVLLKDRVVQAAQQACAAADRTEPDDGTCVRAAVKAAKPQVDAVIAHARASA